MKILAFHQIWYEEHQKVHLYDFAMPYFNETITPYFENTVICNLVPRSDADLIGIASWRLRKKRMSLPVFRQLPNTRTDSLTYEKIISSSFDIALLTPMRKGHGMVASAELSFGRLWKETFGALCDFARKNLEMKIPAELSIPIYGNHFIARRDIYHAYVRECLLPLIHYMDDHHDFFWQNSGYVNAKSSSMNIGGIEGYQTRSGRTDWPIAPFLLETLFSLWIEYRKFSVVIV